MGLFIFSHPLLLRLDCKSKVIIHYKETSRSDFSAIQDNCAQNILIFTETD